MKLNSTNLSGEITNPLALEIPGFPLEAPSKKIAAEEDFIQNYFNSSKDPQKCQGTTLTGLMQTTFLIPKELEPIHIENATSRGEEEIDLPTYLIINSLDLKTMVCEFGSWLLKM